MRSGGLATEYVVSTSLFGRCGVRNRVTEHWFLFSFFLPSGVTNLNGFAFVHLRACDFSIVEIASELKSYVLCSLVYFLCTVAGFESQPLYFISSIEERSG